MQTVTVTPMDRVLSTQELLELIFSHLDPESVKRAALVSRLVSNEIYRVILTFYIIFPEIKSFSVKDRDLWLKVKVSAQYAQ